MILLYRITPFFIALVTAFGFFAFFFHWVHPFIAFAFMFLCLVFLLSRLLQFQLNTFSFWFFLGTACLFFLSVCVVLLLFEDRFAGLLVAGSSVLLLTLYTEFVFLYVHLPSNYQPFSLEYLTLLLNLLSIFYWTCFGFAIRLLVQTPLWVLAPIFFLMSFFLIYGMLWVSKAETHARLYGLFGAVLFVELFSAVSFLPTGFYTSAAFMTVCAYVFFGLTRAHAIHKLTNHVLRRYLVTSLCLLVVIGATSQWL